MTIDIESIDYKCIILKQHNRLLYAWCFSLRFKVYNNIVKLFMFLVVSNYCLHYHILYLPTFFLCEKGQKQILTFFIN